MICRYCNANGSTFHRSTNVETEVLFTCGSCVSKYALRGNIKDLMVAVTVTALALGAALILSLLF